MGELRFASVDDAIEHLSKITSRRIKIAWKDESKEMMKAIADSLKKTPKILTDLKRDKLVDVDSLMKDIDGIDADTKILPTNKGGLKIVQDLPDNVINDIAKRLEDTNDLKERGKLIDYALENKDSFGEFHTKYPKGVQKDEAGPYYRPNPGLIEKGKAFLKKDKGEEGDSDKANRESLESQKQKQADEEQKQADKIEKAVKIITDEAKDAMKDFSDSKTKTEFKRFIKDPSNDIFQDRFIEAFQKDVDAKVILQDEATKYFEFIKDIADIAKEQFGGKIPEFAKSLEDLIPKVKDVEEDATDVPVDTNNKETPTNASTNDNLVDNIVNTWIDKKLKK